MKKTISVLALASIFTAGSAMASGYRIPEQSVDSTSKAGANIASSTRADAAYFNPANMSWISDGFLAEVDATYIHLSSVKYSDYRSPAFDAKSEDESFLLPTGFFVTPSVNGFRLGLALTSPYGLAKRWSDVYAKAVAQEFSLKTYEVNPSVSYNIANKVSLAGGVRMLYADATVKSDASGINLPLSREMSGNTTEWGWNAALSVKPMESLNISATYRSKIDMDFSDSANLNLMGTAMTLGADVTLPAPAVLAISAGYGLTDNLTLELTWDRTFWSDYKELDFNFTPMIATNPYEKPIDKHWKDSDAIRLSATWNVSKNLDLMAGVAYDKNPVPDDTINFELPDSDAWLFSVGTQWKLSKKLDIGVGLLYDYKETRKADSTSRTDSLYPDGKFTDASALLISAGVNYKF